MIRKYIIQKLGGSDFKIIIKNLLLNLYFLIISLIVTYANYPFSYHIFDSIFIELIFLHSINFIGINLIILSFNIKRFNNALVVWVKILRYPTKI
jgi:hypothetical protein